MVEAALLGLLLVVTILAAMVDRSRPLWLVIVGSLGFVILVYAAAHTIGEA